MNSINIEITEETINNAVEQLVYTTMEEIYNTWGIRNKDDDKQLKRALQSELVREVKRAFREVIEKTALEYKKELKEEIINRSVEKICKSVNTKDLLKAIIDRG